MKNKQVKKVTNKMIEVGIGLNKLESLSRILLHCMQDGYDLKEWDTNNLARIMAGKLTETKQTFNDIERILRI